MRTVSKTSSHRTQQALPLLGTGVRTPGKRVVSEYGVGSLKGLCWVLLGVLGSVALLWVRCRHRPEVTVRGILEILI